MDDLGMIANYWYKGSEFRIKKQDLIDEIQLNKKCTKHLDYLRSMCRHLTHEHM